MDPVEPISDTVDDSGPVDHEVLHRYLSLEHIEQLHHLFVARKELYPEELRKALADIAGLEFSDEDYDILFMKLNTNWDSFCQWDEFVSYLIQGFQIDDPLAVQECLVLPIAEETDLRLRQQTYTVTKIEYTPTFSYDGVADWSEGFWITTSREGEINFWRRDWQFYKTGKAISVDLKRAPTEVLDTAVLPDQDMFCVACLECELRFYDIVGTGFTLFMIINRIPNAINALFYHYGSDTRNKLLLGDYVGVVRIIEYFPERKKPIKYDSDSSFVRLSYDDFMEGSCPHMQCTDYGQLLPDRIRHVEFIQEIDCFLACSENDPLVPLDMIDELQESLVIQEMGTEGTKTVFEVPRGVTCFCLYHVKDLLATGGPDGKIRLWDIYRPDNPTDILPGHNSGVKFMFFQDGMEKLYSMDAKKIVKIWDVPNKTLLQTYRDFTRNLYESVPACAYYYDRNRELYVGANEVLSAPCYPEIATEVTDGESHTLPVSVLLYNPLFKVVVSCGLDSFIIVWNHWLNRKLTIIPDAHTITVDGLVQIIEITAACFDPKLQLLLTGAHDGSMKIWNFNNGACINSMSIEQDCEVTAVFWRPAGILAMGWNHVVVDFHVGETEMDFPHGVEWQRLHSDDILCAAMNHNKPIALATCSYSGELLLWMLLTGQAYRRFDAAKPTNDLPVYVSGVSIVPKRRKTRMSLAAPTAHLRERRLTKIVLPVKAEDLRKLTINKLLFLEARPMHPDYGTLLCSLDNGKVQIYSHHPNGKYLGAFNAIHMAGDRVLTMTTDPANKFLFTGSYLGYVKVWLLQNYHVPPEKQARVSKPAMRKDFPFLWKDIFPGRAKRSVAHQPNPWLLSSYQAHRNCVTDIVYVAPSKTLLTSSSDHSIRVWSLGGRYIGLLGSPVKWPTIDPTIPVPLGYRFRVPPDLRREVSFTTAQVLAGGERKILLKGQMEQETIEQEQVEKVDTGEPPLEEPILERNRLMFQERMPSMADSPIKVHLKVGVVQAYEHLKIQNLQLELVASERALRKNSELEMSDEVDRIDTYQFVEKE